MIRNLFRFFNGGGFLKDSLILFSGTMGVNFLNLLFQMFMGRYLRPDEYALLAAMLGVFNVLATPFSVIVSTFNRFSSLLIREGRPGDVLRLGMRWGIRLAIIGAIPSVLCFVMPQFVADFFHFNRVEPVYIFGLVLIGIFCRPVINGVLLGMQRFKIWCVANMLGAAIRLVVGIALVLFVSPFAGWGLLGHGIGFYATILVGGLYILSFARSMNSSNEPLPRIEGFLFGSFFVLFGHAVLMTADVVLVKNLYPESSADFAYGATVARMVLLVPTAFIGAMFPKVVAKGQCSRDQFNLLRKTTLLTLLSTFGAATAIALVAGFLPRFIFGLDEVSADLARWTRMFGFITIPVSFVGVFSRFLIAQHKMLKAGVIPLAAIGYVAGSYMFTSGVDGVLWCLAITSTICCLLLGAVIWFDANKIGEAA